MFEKSFGPKQLAIKYTELFQISNKYHQILEMLFGPQTISNQIYRASSNIKQIASNVWKVIWCQTISNPIYRASSNIIKCLTNKQFQTKCLGSSIFFEKIPKQENVFLMTVCSRISSRGTRDKLVHLLLLFESFSN